MAQAVAAAPDRADARALHDLLRRSCTAARRWSAPTYKSWRAAAARVARGIGRAAPEHAASDRRWRACRAWSAVLLSDERLEVEAYPAFPHGYLALGAGVATRRDGLRAHERVGGAVRLARPSRSRGRSAIAG